MLNAYRRNNERRAKTFLEKYTSHFIVTFASERELQTEQNCNILTPTLMAVSVVSFSFSRAAQPEATGVVSFLLSAGFPYHILSPTGLRNYWGPRGPLRPRVAFPTTSYQQLLWFPTVWLPVFTELYNSSTPTRSPTQSLECHVWSSSSGNNCHAVQRSLSSGVSVYDCIMGFLPCPISSAKSTHAISFDYWLLECVTSFRRITLEWHAWPGRRSKYITRSSCLAQITRFVCIAKSQRILCVSFSTIDCRLCLYHLFLWSNLNFLHNSKPVMSRLILFFLIIYCIFYVIDRFISIAAWSKSAILLRFVYFCFEIFSLYDVVFCCYQKRFTFSLKFSYPSFLV